MKERLGWRGEERRMKMNEQQTKATYLEPMSEIERRRLVAQQECGYDHSGAWCRKCGYTNAEVCRREREAACDRIFGGRGDLGEKIQFSAGFEAGYSYANELLKSFYDLGGAKLP